MSGFLVSLSHITVAVLIFTVAGSGEYFMRTERQVSYHENFDVPGAGPMPKHNDTIAELLEDEERSHKVCGDSCTSDGQCVDHACDTGGIYTDSDTGDKCTGKCINPERTLCRYTCHRRRSTGQTGDPCKKDDQCANSACDTGGIYQDEARKTSCRNKCISDDREKCVPV
mmetsp:Transcript_67922/g.123952  ORF Transcript_67922/g.123952 Transcript_67922/m.123952 type:complete len:170 (-) Transcript_67922:40-549(-)